MPIIEIECSRTVHYSKNVEVTEYQAAAYKDAIDSRDWKAIQECLDQWVDVVYDVVDADAFDILNTSIDDEPLYL